MASPPVGFAENVFPIMLITSAGRSPTNKYEHIRLIPALRPNIAGDARNLLETLNAFSIYKDIQTYDRQRDLTKRKGI